MTQADHPDRREVPRCPKCGQSHVKRMAEIAPESQLRWFRCERCQHIWSKGPRPSQR